MIYVLDASFERSASFRFRCNKYDSTGTAAKAADPVSFQARVFGCEKPVAEQLFEAYKSPYSYDKTPIQCVHSFAP